MVNTRRLKSQALNAGKNKSINRRSHKYFPRITLAMNISENQDITNNNIPLSVIVVYTVLAGVKCKVLSLDWNGHI